VVLAIILSSIIALIERIKKSLRMHSMQVLQDMLNLITFDCQCLVQYLFLSIILGGIIRAENIWLLNLLYGTNVSHDLMLLIFDQNVLIASIRNIGIHVQLILIDITFYEQAQIAIHIMNQAWC